MAITFTKGTKTVTTTESDIFTPIIEETYRALYINTKNMSTNDIVVMVYIWDDTYSEYTTFEPLNQTGLTTDKMKLIPLLPVRRFKVTVRRTSGVGANADYEISYDIVKQTA